MAKIRVTPSLLLKEADKLLKIGEEVEDVGSQVKTAADLAPSHDEQFGPKVKPLGLDAIARSQKLARNLSALAGELRNKGKEFETADLAGVSGLDAILAKFEAWLSSDRLLALDEFPIDLVNGFLILGTLLRPRGGGSPDEESDWEPKLHESLVIEVSNIWDWYDDNINSRLREGFSAWNDTAKGAKLVAGFLASQAWSVYNQKVNVPIYNGIQTWKENLGMWDIIWNESLHFVQEPGLPVDGPITEALIAISRLDSSGNPESIVGADLARIIDERGGVTVSFSDALTGGGNAGVAPFKGWIFLPEDYRQANNQALDPMLVAHELAHVLQRDLPEFPSGFSPSGIWPYTPENGWRGLDPFGKDEFGYPLGDFTLYMEVQSNIVEKAIEYDLLRVEQSSYPIADPQYNAIQIRMDNIADKLATYTGNSLEAACFVVQEYPRTEIYLGEMAHEATNGIRIPDGGWQHWLSQQGFFEESIQYIEDIANLGTPKPIEINCPLIP